MLKRVGEQSIVSQSAEDTAKLGELYTQNMAKLTFLNGELGAGKTQFMKGVARAVNAPQQVSSPTFALENIYEGEGREIHHFDLYRIEDEDALEQLGIFELLEQPDCYLFIEWGEHFFNAFDEPSIQISISKNAPEGERSWDEACRAFAFSLNGEEGSVEALLDGVFNA